MNRTDLEIADRAETVLAGHRMPAHVICIDGTIYVPIPISPMIEAEIKLATGDMPVIAPQDMGRLHR